MAHPAHALTPGARFADHRIEAVVGAGASATVYRAIHEPTVTRRALKVAYEPTEQGDQVPSPVLRHPDIVLTLAEGQTEGRGWQSMEWVPGHDLSRYTAAHRLLPARIALEIVARLAAAVAFAHRAGVTHRDIKPGNVRIHLPTRIVKLGDFGIARMPDASVTRTGLLQGTPAYMAPELLAGASANGSSDLYALGVVLYELLTAHRPHEAESLGALLKAIGHAQPAPLRQWAPDAPAALDALLNDVLSARPEQRPKDGDALASALQVIADTLPQPKPGD